MIRWSLPVSPTALTDQTRQAVDEYIKVAGKKPSPAGGLPVNV
jgi:hypothetical protein